MQGFARLGGVSFRCPDHKDSSIFGFILGAPIFQNLPRGHREAQKYGGWKVRVQGLGSPERSC